MGFYSQDELKNLGLKSYGSNVLISDKSSFYLPSTIEIGNNVRIDDFCILSGKIILGDYIHIAAYSALYAGSAGITIGDFSNISSKVSIYAISDDYSGEAMTNPMVPDKFRNVEQHLVSIGRHCIFGCGSIILPGVEIGEGASFGAMSLIKESCAPWTIYAGIPCRKIRNRSKKLLDFEKTLYEELDNG